MRLNERAKGIDGTERRCPVCFGVVSLMVVVSVALLAYDGAAKNHGFQIKLSLRNGHLRSVVFGIAKGAEEGFDQTHDSPAPPPGRETGYTAFVPPGGDLYLYRDMRPPGDEVEWTFLGKVWEGKPIVVSWSPEALPESHRFVVRRPGAEEPVDMRKTDHIDLAETERLTIVATAVGEQKVP